MKEDVVLKKILDFAKERDEVRAVIMNGSRVNPNAPVDKFQDYDVMFIVKDLDIFYHDQLWIDRFGSIIMKQVNPSKGEKLIYQDEEEGHKWRIFLMLFEEGFRIDLGFHEFDSLKELDDSLSVVLLDKDGIVPELAPPNERSYITKKPTEDEFNFATNEFWWCLTNVAKGLWRDELVYAKSMYEIVVRRVYTYMIKWYIGMEHNWTVNTGSFGKWFKRYLSKEHYELLQKSYAGSEIEAIWNSVFAAIELFRTMGKELANTLDYTYPNEDDQRVTAYLEQVRSMNHQ